jgi:predicted DNA-binding WGR domain protein
MPIFVCQDESSNKFWDYEVNGNDAIIKWGRLGLVGQVQVKSFSVKFDRDDFIDKKVREKISGGYKEITPEKYAILVLIAQTIGVGAKVDEIYFATKSGCYISEVSQKDLHKPGTKPLVYARIVGRRKSKDENAPVSEFLLDVDKAYRIKTAGHVRLMPLATVEHHATRQLTEEIQIKPGDDCEKMATMVGEIIGKVLL